MFKDFNKYLKVSLRVYLYVLVFIVILKLVGLDYFGIADDNATMLRINNFVLKYHLEKVYYSFTLFFHVYVYLTVVCKDISKKMIRYCFIITILAILLKIFEVNIANTIIITIIDLIFLTIACLIHNKFKDKKIICKNSLKLFLINVLFQLISLYLRNIKFYNINLSFLIRSILDMDYILMLLIYQRCIFLEGGVLKCGVEVFSFLQKKINLKNLRRKLQRKLLSYKSLEKDEQIAFILYIVFSLIWNTLSVVLILLVARLNNTLVECIFILTSFWLSKHSFGRPFHLKSMAQCFVVSNLTYYVLNRITAPIGISILVPTLLGVGLSYTTSKLVKKVYKPLYIGMPEKMFKETITKVVDEDSLKYKICYEYFIERRKITNIAIRHNYSEDGIKKIKDRINKKIKELE